MIPDLGKYSVYVLSAYGTSIALLILLVGISLLKGRRVRAELARTEDRIRRDG